MRDYLDSAFVLEADIDLNAAPYNSGNGWKPIGTETAPFSGTFHGNGHTIRGLYIFEGNNIGLFGTIEGKAEISDLTLKDADIRTTKSGVAILVGQMLGGTISNTHVSGAIKADSQNVGTLVGYMKRGSIADSSGSGRIDNHFSWYTGGLVGRMEPGTTLSRSSADTTTHGFYYTGGLVGANAGTIEHSFAKGSVANNASGLGGLVGVNDGEVRQSYALTHVTGGSNQVGGLAGINGSKGFIEQSFAKGTIETESMAVGGLVGENQGVISDAYANSGISAGKYREEVVIGGLVGINQHEITRTYAAGTIDSNAKEVGGLIGKLESNGTVNDSYYDQDQTGQTDTGKGMPLSSVQMKEQESFTDWDFTDVWQMDEYPAFQWE
ncbi:GLUG motif-containing protein [Brevibacillus borstelensis]|uniref:GLUG motif-containing protein n=1 Tax=Brevibacillus borstelensis TaxID=45462 RepID=UPI002E1FC953